MTGTLVNFFAIMLGGVVGLLLKRGIPARINDSVLKIEGVVVAVIGLNGMLTVMLSVDPETGALQSNGELLLLISLVLGCIAGELVRLDDLLNRFGGWVERRIGDKGDGFSKGFISASLIFSVGAMSVIGPLNDGLNGDSGILLIKSMLDGTTAVILASTLGFGVLFSAVPVFLFQGAVALLAGWISPYVSGELLNMFSMAGYAIVLCIGINFLLDAKIKTANLLPALAVPVVYYFIREWLPFFRQG